MTGLTAVSLFAGVGGFDLALERIGVDVVAAVEIDDAARGVLADRFPDTALFTDVREVDGDELRAAGFVPDRGILTAGFPCQDLSVAGHRRGLGEGTRSGLFWEIDRLVAELRPAWIVLENVAGLLSAACPCSGTGEHGGCTEPHSVSGGACAGGCFPAHGGAMGLVLGALADRGYGFAYRVLDAQYFGVPQRRRRVIIVGRAGADARGAAQVLLEPEGCAGDPAPGVEAGSGSAGAATVSTLQGGGQRGYRVDAESAAGGHLLPVSATVSAKWAKWAKGTGGPSGDEAQNLIAFDAAQITSRENRSNPQPGDPAPSLAATGYPHVAHTLSAGGAVSPGVRPAGRRSEDDSNLVPVSAAVRRLTPLECERLQGFPDQWTATSNGRPQADAARYRQCGNAIAVPVGGWVVRRLVEVAAAEPHTREPTGPEVAA